VPHCQAMERPDTNPIAVSIRALSKRYATGHQALKQVDLEIRRGEIFALLGPNGAGKTTLISIVCGIVTPSEGSVIVDGMDIARDWRATRSCIGLVPQELTTDAFETVWNAVRFSRGLFGKAPDPAHLETVLRDLSLWDKRDAKLMTLSGGMKRRLLIAKALSHEPSILFLDEPTAGVDVELRREMWGLVRRLRERGVTIILTTHYIEEAEEMADRVGVIHEGELVVVEDKRTLMKKLGKRVLRVELAQALSALPPALADWPLDLTDGGRRIEYHVTNGDGDSDGDGRGVGALLAGLAASGIAVRDVESHATSLEEIFVGLVSRRAGQEATR
jgi:ABC-2 type transport system ATP-binding protein